MEMEDGKRHRIQERLGIFAGKDQFERLWRTMRRVESLAVWLLVSSVLRAAMHGHPVERALRPVLDVLMILKHQIRQRCHL